jgi:membrane fusion protein (multidrug efflux system)
MLKPLSSLSIALMIGALALSGCAKKDAAGKGARGPAAVGYVTVQTQSLNVTQELSGRTSAYLVSEVRPQVGGIVKSRLFTEGGKVSAGQSLYQIDPATYQAALASAQASQAQAQANYDSAKLTADRYTKLIAIKAVSQQDYDDAETTMKTAAATLALQKAAVQTASINLNYTKVLSPISGVVGKSSVTPGALVTANQTDALATVQDLSRVYVDITQSATDLLKLKRAFATGELGAPDHADVTLLLDDGSTYPLTGRLEFSDVTVDPATGSITLRAVFENPDGLLLPGMFVRARLVKGTVSQGILVPQGAVVLDPKGGASVLLAGEDGKAHKQVIALGQMQGTQWQVLNGLKTGDKVISEGAMSLKDKGAIKAAPVKPAAAAESATTGH